MRPVLIGIGAVIAFFGLVGLVFGLEISDIERGQTQAICGAVSLTGGILIIAAGLVLGRLGEISQRLAALAAMQGAPSARASQGERHVPTSAELFGDASRAWQDRQEDAMEAPAPATEPEALGEPAEPRAVESTIPRRFATLSRAPRPSPPAPVPAPPARTAAEVAAAAVAAAIALPEAGFAEPAPAEEPSGEAGEPAPEPAMAGMDSNAAEARPESTDAEEPRAPGRGLRKFAKAARSFDPFGFSPRSQPLSEPAAEKAAAAPAEGETAAQEVGAPPDARPQETSAAVEAPVSESQPARGRFPMRSMTLPRGTWPGPPGQDAWEDGAAMPDEEPAQASGFRLRPMQDNAAERAQGATPDTQAPSSPAEAEAHSDQQATAPEHEVQPEPTETAAAEAAPPTAPELEVVGRYESNGATYVMYADGSIDAETETGVWRFASLDELKAYIEGQNG